MAEKRILVAEDHSGIARELRKYIRELGYHLQAVVSRGELALQSVAENKPDLVLMDVRLPGKIDGLQAAEQIRAQGVPIVFLANRSDHKLFERAGITHPFGYLLRPFRRRELRLVIEAALYRHAAEARSMDTLEDYQQYLDGTGLVFCDWELSSGEITINSLGAALLGLSAANPKLSVNEWYRKVHPAEIEDVRRSINDHLAGSTPFYEIEHRILGPGDTWVWVITRGKVVAWDVQGQPLRMFSTSREITEQKQMLFELQESVGRLRVITENMADVVGEIDRAGKIRYISPSVQRVFGYTQQQVLENLFSDFIHPDDLGHVRRNVSDSLATLLEGSLELRVRHLDGHFVWVEATGKAMQDGRGIPQGFIFSTREITQRRESEEALKSLNEQLTAWINDLERRNRQTELINEMGEWLQSCREPEEAYAIIGQYVEKVFWEVSGALYVRSPSQDLFKAIATWGKHLPYELVFGPQDCWALRRMRVHIAADPSALMLCRHVIGFDHPVLSRGEPGTIGSAPAMPGGGFHPHICVPLIIRGEARGVLHLVVQDGHLIRQWEQLALTLCERSALTLANLELQKTLRAQAIRDPLTGLFNRRYMEETLSRELRRSVRFRRPLGVIMLDIDYFKHFNDDFSYAAGDLLLQALGGFLQQSLRHGDVVCRYGGEEFILILPEASLEDTVKRAEQVREGVKELRIHHRGMPLGTITISLGVAAYPEHGDHPEAILHAVDTALHIAKNGGRDRLVISEI